MFQRLAIAGRGIRVASVRPIACAATVQRVATVPILLSAATATATATTTAIGVRNSNNNSRSLVSSRLLSGSAYRSVVSAAAGERTTAVSADVTVTAIPMPAVRPFT